MVIAVIYEHYGPNFSENSLLVCTEAKSCCAVQLCHAYRGNCKIVTSG